MNESLLQYTQGPNFQKDILWVPNVLISFSLVMNKE